MIKPSPARAPSYPPAKLDSPYTQGWGAVTVSGLAAAPLKLSGRVRVIYARCVTPHHGAQPPRRRLRPIAFSGGFPTAVWRLPGRRPCRWVGAGACGPLRVAQRGRGRSRRVLRGLRLTVGAATHDTERLAVLVVNDRPAADAVRALAGLIARGLVGGPGQLFGIRPQRLGGRLLRRQGGQILHPVDQHPRHALSAPQVPAKLPSHLLAAVTRRERFDGSFGYVGALFNP